MTAKYARHLEDRDFNPKTGKIWAIQDVPNTWKAQTEKKVIADGYYFAEDGTAYKEEEE